MVDLTRHVRDLHDDLVDILFSRMRVPLEEQEIQWMFSAVRQAIARRMLEAKEGVLNGVRCEVRTHLEAERRRRMRMLLPSDS